MAMEIRPDNPADSATTPVRGWAAELADAWRRLPCKGPFLLALTVWVALFHFLGNSTLGYVETHSLFGWLNWVYRVTPDESHGRLIPFVVAGLFWWKRRLLLDLPKSVWFPALGLVAAGLFLHIGGYVVQQARLSVLGFLIGTYGMIGLYWGWPVMRHSFFPFFLLVFCMPLGTLAQEITVPLRLLVSYISVGLSQLALGIDVIRNGTEIFSPDGTFQYDVAPACSGIRSLITILVLTIIYGFMSFTTWWKRGLTIGIAIPLAVVGNVVRITGVIVVAEAFGQDAGLLFHDYAGFVTFGLAFAGVLTLGYFLGESHPATSPLPSSP